MGGVPSTSADRNQVEDRSTAIGVMMSGLEFQGFRFGRVIGYYAHTTHEKSAPERQAHSDKLAAELELAPHYSLPKEEP